jgi:hypothetical protein
VVKRSSSPGVVGRVAVLVSVAAILVASCAAPADSPSQSVAPSQQVESAPPTPGLTPGADLGPLVGVTSPVVADPGYPDSVLALGLDEGTARFMADTMSTVDVVDAHTYVVHHAFPNGATGEVTYHLFQGTSMSPEDPPEVAGEVSGDQFRFTATYAISSADIPEDVRRVVVEGLPASAPARLGVTDGAASLLGLAPAGTAEGSVAADSKITVGVVVDGVISQGKSVYIDSWFKRAEGQGWTKTAKSWKAFKAGKKVWEALGDNDVITSAMAELKALRNCAENPTNPATLTEYEGNPQAKQVVLDELTRIENDIQSNTMVLFTMRLADTGSSLIKAAPWLKFITGPATKFSRSTLLDLLQSYLQQAEQRVVPCRASYAISGSIPSKPGGITLSGTACSLEKPFQVQTQGDIVGTLRFTPRGETGGTWSFAGSETQAGFGVDGSGGYSVSLSEDNKSGTLDFGFILTINIPGGRNQTGGGPTTLTLSEAPLCTG